LKETRDVKPAISDNWKQLFHLQPQLYRPDPVKYFDKDDYAVSVTYQNPTNEIYTSLRKGVESEWDYIS
jgi:neutral trehalase